MILIEAMVYDIRDFVTMVCISLLLGCKWLIKNWTREDTITISKGSFYVLVGYIALVSVLLIGE